MGSNMANGLHTISYGKWLISSVNGSNRQFANIGKWLKPAIGSHRQMAQIGNQFLSANGLHIITYHKWHKSGKWLFTANGSIRQRALFVKWLFTANGSLRQMALIGKWLFTVNGSLRQRGCRQCILKLLSSYEFLPNPRFSWNIECRRVGTNLLITPT